MDTNIQFFNNFKDAGMYARNHPGSKVVRDGSRFKVEHKFSVDPAMISKPQIKPVTIWTPPPAIDDDFDSEITF